MSEEQEKRQRSGARRIVVTAAVIIAVVLGTIWYKQYSAEQSLHLPPTARPTPAQEGAATKPRPVSNVADRPSRERGPRP